MRAGLWRTSLLFFLAAIFTAGLTFASVELPYRLDALLQDSITMPGGDSHADVVSRLRTELFMDHYNVRTIGYGLFFLLVGLIAAGFLTPKSNLAAAGAFGVMLVVFAQFASVMFFLAGLGVLNAMWLPVLDISYGLQDWGLVINAPRDLIHWLLGLFGMNAFWPTVLFFTASGIFVLLLGTYAWLSARTGGKSVADSWVYRLSRHPQYLGWVLWTYGAYLLIQRMLYPKRSWGIGASLPWLLSTMVIIAVAMMEELNMRRRFGAEYEAYRSSTSFLFPNPRVVSRIFSSPCRLLFKKDRPDRRREVVAVVGVYTAVLLVISTFFYGGGLEGTVTRLSSPQSRAARIGALITEVRQEPNDRRKSFLMLEVTEYGDAAVDPILALLTDEETFHRVLAAEALERIPAERSVPALCSALTDPDENVRSRANSALGVIGSEEALPYLVPLLEDPAMHIRIRALDNLAALGAEEVLARAPEFMESADAWVRMGGVVALGTLGSAEAIPLLHEQLSDESARVRREIVVALLRIGSPRARPILEDARSDEDYEVRIYAAAALKRLPSY